jgi:hypothetical protein
MARYKPMDETWFMYEIDHKDVPIFINGQITIPSLKLIL